MRRVILIGGAVLTALVALWLFGLGGAGHLAARAAEGQRDVQNAMAGALRQLQRGETGALLGLWGLCFAYGFFHAAGPGHGKFLIGGYGLARRIAARKLMGLAVASSLAQAATAVILVYASLFFLGWGRDEMQGAADRGFARLSDLLIGGIGLWLIWRGVRAWWRTRPAPAPAVEFAGAGAGFGPSGGLSGLGGLSDLGGLAAMDRGEATHVHRAGEICETCGHAHGPTPEQAAAVRSWRDAAMVIAAIAARPCTGALFLLLLTWRIRLDWAGVVGAFVMGLGTASVTLVVALASVSLRESALMQVAGGPQTARVMATLEMLAGLIVLVVAVQLLRMGW